MISIEAQIPLDILDAIDDAYERSPGIMAIIVKRRSAKVKKAMLAELRNEPPVLTEANYPLDWQSDRQRRYVMAMLREDNNLPYGRTHELAKAWDILIAVDNGQGVFTVINNDPAAEFVQGDRAQRMHLANGWPQAAPIIVKYEDILADQLIDEYFLVADPFAGIPQI